MGVLTSREVRICTLASTDLANRAIAQQLFLSPRTVGAHLHPADRKLGISTRTQLGTIVSQASNRSDSPFHAQGQSGEQGVDGEATWLARQADTIIDISVPFRRAGAL